MTRHVSSVLHPTKQLMITLPVLSLQLELELRIDELCATFQIIESKFKPS